MQQDGFVAWKLPPRIQSYFRVQLVLDPYMRDYFMFVQSPENDEVVYATDIKIMDIQKNFFYPSSEYAHYNWMCFKSYPLSRNLFPMFLTHDGSLFGPNLISDPNSNYFSNQIIGPSQLKDLKSVSILPFLSLTQMLCSTINVSICSTQKDVA